MVNKTKINKNSESNTEKIKIRCNECGHVFSKKITASTYEIKCQKCRSYDTEPA